MAQWLEAFAAGTDHLDPIARTVMVERINSPKLSLALPVCAHAHTRANNASTLNN